MASGGYKFLFNVDDVEATRVFYDPTKMRRNRVRRLFLASACVLLTWAILFFGKMLEVPVTDDAVGFEKSFPSVQQDPGDYAKGHQNRTHQAHLVQAAASGETATENCRDRSPKAFAAFANGVQKRFFGHIPSELAWAPLSLNKSCGTLSVLVPDWIDIKTTGAISGTVSDKNFRVSVAEPSVRESVEAYLKSNKMPPRLMPTVKLDAEIDPGAMAAQLARPDVAQLISRDLVASAVQLKSAGLCLNFDQLGETDLFALQPFFTRVASALREAGLQSCLVASAGQEAWQDTDFSRPFDLIILKAFREPWVGSPPGPLAADDWFEDLSKRAIAAIGPERLILAIGNFGAEWTMRQPLPETLPYAEALTRVGDPGGQLTFSPEIGNSFSSYRDENRDSHKLWLLDAVSAHNQILVAERLGIQNFAIWSLGREDPDIWTVLDTDNHDTRALASALSTPKLDAYVAYHGKGPFLRVREAPQTGLRTVEVNLETGRFNAVKYLQLPRPYVLERYGQPQANKLVLTFDDGPDPVFTKAVLDTLKKTGTPAAFFVVGTHVMEEPDLLIRMISEGHEVGSHTFTHPRMDLVSQSRSSMEHTIMSRLIAGYTGHQTHLYREPFLRGGGPIEGARVRSLQQAQSRGEIIAGMDIVPLDWEGWSSQQITEHVINQVNDGAGNVILLHDGGEDRTATVSALPSIIEKLRAQGYEFTSLADLLGTTRASLMPEVTGRWLLFDRLSFEFMSFTWLSLATIFWVVLAIGVIRMLIILILARIRMYSRPVDTDFAPKVCVVIPAYDEEKAIAKCISSVLNSDYANFEVIVIDDGSQDETFNEILRFRNNPRVQIYAQLNQGKAAALNAAVANTDADIMVCLDADTVIDPQAIGYLVRRFANPRIGAVAGKISVGNRKNLLTRLQALEYVTAQNFDRRAYDLLNGILVVPGAIGAWRTSAVVEAGRYRKDTLTEDADLTIAVNRAGYRVAYEDKAVAYTNAPETVRQLLGQRLRWSLGMFQCAWKHKGAFFERRTVGMISIPDMLIFGYLFPLLAPIADVFVLLLIYKLFAGGWTGEIGTDVADTPGHLILAYLILPLLDLFIAAYALKTDGRENMKLLWLFPFQRFFYRQLLYFSVYRSVLRALTGSLADWGRVRRRLWWPKLRRAAA